MISRGGEGIGHAEVDRTAVVEDAVGLAVHQPIGTDDLGAGDKADALVAEADAQHRQLWAEMADDVVAHAPFPRRTRAGRDDDVRRLQRLDLIDGDLVVAEDLDRPARDPPRPASGPGCR